LATDGGYCGENFGARGAIETTTAAGGGEVETLLSCSPGPIPDQIGRYARLILWISRRSCDLLSRVVFEQLDRFWRRSHLMRRVAHRTFLFIFQLLLFGCSAPEAVQDSHHPLTAAVKQGIARGEGSFDHSAFDQILQSHVRENGDVDYSALLRNRKALQDYVSQIGSADLSQYGRDELLALIINAYNALTLDWILQHYPGIRSIKQTPDPWKAPRHLVGGEQVSLDFLEHSLLRVPELFDEPRIHFGVNCASRGCPTLYHRAFTGEAVLEQLEEATRKGLGSSSQLRVEGDRVLLSQIFSWFRGDFTRDGKPLSQWLIPRVPSDAREILLRRGDDGIAIFGYDWALNDISSSRE